MPPDHAPAVSAAARLSPRRLAPLGVLVAAMVLVFAMGWHRHLSLETLVDHRSALDALVMSHYVAALIAFMAVYVAAVSLSIPGAVFLTMAAGVLFGTLVGGIAVVIAATIGASVIFLIARSAFATYVVRRAGPRLSRIVDGFCADAFSYLLFLRLVPLFPFFLVNLAPALVGVRLPVFVAATALGIIPATFVFVSVGAGLDSVIRAQDAMYRACLAAGRSDCRLDFELAGVLTPQLLGALVALGLLALVPVVVKRVFMRPTNPANPAGRGCRPDA